MKFGASLFPISHHSPINETMKTHTMTLALAAIFGNTAFAAFPAAMPEFKNEKQLATWRAEQASKADTRTAEETHAFYTGKPYVDSTGGYAFQYRSYNPELARWTSEDPSGFPDGANGYISVNNQVTNEFDPNGLWQIKLVSGCSQNVNAYDGGIGCGVTTNGYLTADNTSFKAVSFSIGGFLLAFSSAEAQITGSLTCTADGRIQCSLSSPIDKGSSWPISSNVAVSATYENDQKEVDIGITFGGAVTAEGSIGFSGFSVSNSGVCTQKGFNTLIYEVE
jgi:RHS repeat-associated protein